MHATQPSFCFFVLFLFVFCRGFFRVHTLAGFSSLPKDYTLSPLSWNWGGGERFLSEMGLESATPWSRVQCLGHRAMNRWTTVRTGPIKLYYTCRKADISGTSWRSNFKNQNPLPENGLSLEITIVKYVRTYLSKSSESLHWFSAENSLSTSQPEMCEYNGMIENKRSDSRCIYIMDDLN